MHRTVGSSLASRLNRIRLLVLLLAGLLFFSTAAPSLVAAPSIDEGEPGEGVKVVGQVPLFEEGEHLRDGWLILNPRTRRGYQVFASGANTTTLISFDLDTLQPLRRGVIDSFRVTEAGNPNGPGDVVHAVDEEGGIIYLAGAEPGLPFAPRTLAIAQVDESKLNEGPLLPETVPGSDFVPRRLRVPASQLPQFQVAEGAGQVGIAAGGGLRGMTFSMVSGHPKLLLLYGTANTGTPGVHLLAQWDPEKPEGEHGDWVIKLDACSQFHLVWYQGWAYQLEVLRGDASVYVACMQGNQNTQVVRFPLLDGNGVESSTGVPSESTFEVFPLPRKMSNVIADPGSERLLVQVQLRGFTWWVFDGVSRAWVGALGESADTTVLSAVGLDLGSGRLYSLVPDHGTQGADPPIPVQGGLQFSDIRLNSLPQFTNAIPSIAYPGQFRISVDPQTTERPRRVFVRRGNRMAGVMEPFYLVAEDTVPVASEPPLGDLDSNTTDVLEESGITGANFDVFGSGFGFRSLLVGGITPAISRELDFALPAACYEADRELVMGGVQSARLSNLNASAASLSLFADEGTKADLESPATRCWPGTFDQNLPTSTAQAVDDAAGQRWDSDGDGDDDYTSECSGDDGQVDAPTPPKTEGVYSSWAECDYSGGSVRASSSGRLSPGGGATPVSVMSASSIVTARKAEEGGTIVEVDSIARGIEIAGVGTIGLVRSVAVVGSAGRPETARATFDRFICGVDIPGFNFTLCLTPDQQKQFVAGLNQLLARMNGKAFLRQPDPDLYRGTDGGYLAAVQRNRVEASNDKLVTRDHSETVPGLEIIFYRGDSPTAGSGRQVFQFAAVQASSAYGIFCLFGESPNSAEEETSCVRPTSELKVQLTDDFEENPTPLPGGVFQIHLDEDGDGLLGVDDAVLELGDEEAVCTTTDDGVGDCVFELPPGNYIVHQVEAPDGFAPSPDCAVFLPAFTSLTCDFVNSPNIGLIHVGLTDDSPEANPLSGGVFELYIDDGDQKLGKGDTKLASCTTDVFGDCVYKLSDISGKALPIYCTGSPAESEELKELIEIECIFDPDKGGNILAVELGTFIVHQTVAPPDYSVAEDQVLPLVNPWDIGIASFVNGLAPVEGMPPVEIPGTPARASTSVVEGGTGPRAPVVQSESKSAPAPQGVVTKILRAPAEALSFLLRHPKEAVMFASIWLMLAAPLWLMVRRRSITGLGGLTA